jgi:hypothetical protein
MKSSQNEENPAIPKICNSLKFPKTKLDTNIGANLAKEV